VTTPVGVWYLSFVSDKDDWLGGCFVLATDALSAVQEAHRQGCNPGGEVAIMGPGPVNSVPLDWQNRLLTRDEVEQGPYDW
jgi:hypothetical protein